jgi:hypothetical protein
MSKRLQRRNSRARDRGRCTPPKRDVSWGSDGIVVCERCRLFVLPCQCCIPANVATSCPNCDGPVVRL